MVGRRERVQKLRRKKENKNNVWRNADCEMQMNVWRNADCEMQLFGRNADCEMQKNVWRNAAKKNETKKSNHLYPQLILLSAVGNEVQRHGFDSKFTGCDLLSIERNHNYYKTQPKKRGSYLNPIFSEFGRSRRDQEIKIR
jgi:hypothetical protein